MQMNAINDEAGNKRARGLDRAFEILEFLVQLIERLVDIAQQMLIADLVGDAQRPLVDEDGRLALPTPIMNSPHEQQYR